jgi:glycolate oxidase FAD binding subunit
MIDTISGVTKASEPRSPQELAEALGEAGARGQPIELGGHLSKRLMGGPSGEGALITTAGMTRVRQYEPRDLTISVEAGISYSEVSRLLAEHDQMLPLDPPFSDEATIGGILATNSSGPRRRLYGAARDMLIGVEYATLEGKLVQSGGMVVKNVAGLDTGKLMIGSFGTLAAIAVANFKVTPRPRCESTMVLSCAGLEEAIAARDAILKSQLQPAAIDLLNPPASGLAGPAYLLAVQVAGNAAAMERYEREWAALGAIKIPAGPDRALWRAVQEFTPQFLETHPEGAVARVSCTLKELKFVLQSAPGPAVARAGSGVCYVYFDEAGSAAQWTAETSRLYRDTVIEFAPAGRKPQLNLWPAPGPELELMKRIKLLFDPQRLLNRGRLYHHL